MSQTGLHSIQFKALCLIVIRAAVRHNAPHWETDIQLPQELLPNPWCTQTITRACLRSQWSLELAARVCLRWHWALESASFKKMLRSDLLCSFPLDSVLLGNVHGYARVRTSIYIYAGRVSSRTYFFLGVLVGDMAQIGRSPSSSRRAQVCWLGPEPFAKLFLHILTPRGRLGAG